jgi:hypothetical protein
VLWIAAAAIVVAVVAGAVVVTASQLSSGKVTRQPEDTEQVRFFELSAQRLGRGGLERSGLVPGQGRRIPVRLG